MNVFLMFKNQDFDPEQPLPANEKDLIHDLELNTLLNAMALGDDFLFQIGKTAILSGLKDMETIRYRQEILKDCLNNPGMIREMYDISLESTEKKRKSWLGIFTHSPSAVLYSAINMMEMFVEILKKLKGIADEHAEEFASDGFTRLFAMIKKELDDEYFAVVENHLKQLKFKDGVLISAELGDGNECSNYTLRLPDDKNRNLFRRVLMKKAPVYSFAIHPRDNAGTRALSDIKNRAVNLAANALAQAADHIDAFLNMLRVELAFYIGCINLFEQLKKLENPVTFPELESTSERYHSFRGLYDVSLALTMKRKVVGNDIDADQKDLAIITGANQGGKSTFLRSIGLTQLMMQSGMFVPAEYLRANLCEAVFTHFKRKEDAAMKSGKLDEELARMSEIVDMISPNALILFNESFAATNEREGSEIARQITSALIDQRVKVFFVTHMYEFAHTFYDQQRKEAFFLRAERKKDGRRTFKLIEGEPLQTSFGIDVYHSVFDDHKN